MIYTPCLTLRSTITMYTKLKPSETLIWLFQGCLFEMVACMLVKQQLWRWIYSVNVVPLSFVICRLCHSVCESDYIPVRIVL
ncbi:uncharacterized protein DEA37_0001109 [Paragonimus westermani]|uniref:Uncharacterized protein n=1 Tax=Paragonimus westermani TaxID=34504 RepID=A0A5J4NK56_9TREM|nr:uncharacterized protein DEA37_0001109 [Paragonimus westermani]